MTTKEVIAKAPSGRVRRTPVGIRNVLTVSGKDPDFVYRVVNDTGDRVQQFIGAGYETVSNATHVVGDNRVNAPSAEGTIAQASVGGGMKGIVMRIKKEWYSEDQEAKLRQVAETEATTKQKALEGSDYGKLTTDRD